MGTICIYLWAKLIGRLAVRMVPLSVYVNKTRIKYATRNQDLTLIANLNIFFRYSFVVFDYCLRFCVCSADASIVFSIKSVWSMGASFISSSQFSHGKIFHLSTSHTTWYPNGWGNAKRGSDEIPFIFTSKFEWNEVTMGKKNWKLHLCVACNLKVSNTTTRWLYGMDQNIFNVTPYSINDHWKSAMADQHKSTS